MSRFRILPIPVVAVAVLVLLLAGSAAAYFTADGSGSGDAGTTTLAELTVVAGTASGELYPGGTAAAVLEVTNPNPFSVSIVAIVAAEGAVVATGGIGTCTQPAVSFVAPPQETVSELAELAPGGPTTIALPGAVSMGTAAETACQGATFAVPVTVQVVR